MEEKKIYKSWSFWACVVGISLSLWFIVSCVVGCVGKANAIDRVETPTSRIEALKRAPIPTADIDVIDYVALAPNSHWESGYYSQVFQVSLNTNFNFVGSEDNLIVEPSASYDKVTLQVGYLDYELSSDPYERVYFYLVPTITEMYETTDNNAFVSFLNENLYSTEAFNNGYSAGKTDGYVNGYDVGYGVGKADGYAAGTSTQTSTLTETLVYIFQAPFDQIYRFFNFNILGVNILALVCSLITVMLVVFVVKKLK